MLLDFLLAKNNSFSLTFPRIFCHASKRKPLYAKRDMADCNPPFMMKWQFRLSCRNIIFYFPFSCDVTLPSKWSETLTELRFASQTKTVWLQSSSRGVVWRVCVPFCEDQRVHMSYIHTFMHSVVFHDRSVALSKAALHRVQSSSSPFNFQDPRLSLRTSGSCLLLSPRLHPILLCLFFNNVF
jgi:hypothetical protein